VKRVQAWRGEHPGYWKKCTPQAGSRKPVALQDLVVEQPPTAEAITGLRNQLFERLEQISRPLQDMVDAQALALTGLTAMMTGDTLQEEIGRTLAACYERGQRIGGMVPWMQARESRHERTHSDSTPASATGSGAVQLG
jgi:hypothetical protein